MTFRAEPFGVFVDDLVSGLTGGTTREDFVFAAERRPFELGAQADAVAATVRVHGLAGDAYTRFRSGTDFTIGAGGTVDWAEGEPGQPPAGATWPDEGTTFWASYERTPDPAAPPRLTDRNPGSIVRTLADSFAREYAVLSRQLEQVHDAAFVETATGRDLEAVVGLVGITRRSQLVARGEVVFARSTPASGDVHVPAGTRLSTVDAPAVTVETTDDATLRRGTLSVAAPVAALVAGAAGVAPAGSLSVVHRPILGIERATNPQALAFGSGQETDDALRRRARRALDHAGRSTVGALVGALTTVEGIREQDVLVQEDHAAHPGVVKVTVAVELDDARRHAAALALEDARPAGVRLLHNLPLPPPPPVVLGPGGGPPPPPEPVPPAPDDLWFTIGVAAVVTPTDADLAAPQKAALVAAVEAAVEAFVGALGAGDAVVYNRLVAAVLDVEGAFDVVLEVFPSPATEPTGRWNLFPVPSSRRPRLDQLDVTLRGALIALDVTVTIERHGLAASLEPGTALANAGDDIRALLADLLPTLAVPITPAVLAGALPATEDWSVEEVHYVAEFLDEGLRVVTPDREIAPAPAEQAWLRSLVVTEAQAVSP